MNIAILAHIDAGKTTLSERILWAAGKILRAGDVEDGLATMDYLPEEKEKGITIEAGISNFMWRDIWWNLIDAPGHIDFGMEADTALEAADGAVLVISAVDGIQPQTYAAWEKLKSLNKPCVIFFNKTDLPEARLEESFWEIEEQFGVNPVLLSWPVKNEGVWDVLSGTFLKHNDEGREDISDFLEEKGEMENLRREACEAASTADDKLLEKLLSNKIPETAELLAGLQKLFYKGSHILCYAGSAKKNVGIRSLLNGLSFFLKPQEIKSKELGQVIRYRSFAGIGEVAIFKSYKNLKKDKFPDGLKFYRIHAQNLSEVSEIVCGDIYAVKGMLHKKIGDYSPLLQMRIECLKSEDWAQIDDALKSIERIDHSMRITENKNDGSWTLHAMGAVQFDFILSRLKREYHCKVKAGEPSVEFHEVLSKNLDAVENFCQIGETSVNISLSAEMLENERCEIASKIPAVISALEEFCEAGVLGKGSLRGIKFILHKLEISGNAPQNAAQAVVKKACLDAAKMLVEPSAVEIHEPWVNLTVQCPSAHAGAVTKDLLARGAKILNSDGDGKKHRFYANAPLSKLARYTTELLSITRGSGNFSIFQKKGAFMKKIIFISLFMCIASFTYAQDPVALLKQNDLELQKELKKKSHTEKDMERIKYLSSGLFDFAKMAERSLPKKTLDTISKSAKAEFAKEFQRMIENSSVHKFKTSKYTPPDSTIYEEPKFKKDGAEVWVSIHSWSKGKDMLMVYKMDKEANSWRVWDLVIDDLSTTRNYQDQFKSILETKSFKELIKTVKEKADEYAK